MEQQSIFRIFTSALNINYLQPWNKEAADYTGTCTVVLIEGKKYYLTCFHVVEGAVRILINDVEEKLLFYSRFMDLAICSCSLDLPAIGFGEIKTGEKVRVYGYPGTLRGLAVAEGHINRLTKLRWFWGKILAFQLDPVVNPGNSGGPVLNSQGLIVGIVFGTKMGMNIHHPMHFAIPYFSVKFFIDSFIYGELKFAVPKFTWQHADKYMNIEEPVIVNKKHKIKTIEGIQIHADGQIYLRDFLVYFGFQPMSNEMISFHYLIPFLNRNYVLLDDKKYPLILYPATIETQPKYLIHGDFVFTEISKTTELKLGRQLAVDKVYISYCKTKKYERKILNINWTEFEKKIKSFKGQWIIPFFNDGWDLYLNAKDIGTNNVKFLF